MGDVHLHVTSVTITAPDPLVFGRVSTLAYSIGRVTAEEGPRPGEPPTAGWAQIRSTGRQPRVRPSTSSTRSNGHRQPRPSEPGEQHATQHLDIQVSDLDAAVEHAISAGASLAPVQPQQRVRVLSTRPAILSACSSDAPKPDDLGLVVRYRHPVRDHRAGSVGSQRRLRGYPAPPVRDWRYSRGSAQIEEPRRCRACR